MEEEMDVLMEEGCEHEQHSGCSSTSTIVDDFGGNYWSDWSPVIDWGPFCGEADDFHGLVESMLCDNNANSDDTGEYGTAVLHEPSSTATSEGLSLGSSEGEGEGDGKGLRLVHLLMAAAEALTGPRKSRDLTRVILVRLKELVPAAGGTTIERLAAHFTDALHSLLEGAHSGMRTAGSHRRDDQQCHPSDVLAAFQLLQDMSPDVKFGHFTANQAILESVSGDRRVHIIDYHIMEGVQWASLMQAMVSRKDGPPPPHLRITAITRGGGGGGNNGGRKLMGSVQETGRRLVAFAASIGLPFSFGQCRLDPGENFRPSAIKAVKGETIIANCVLHPPHVPHRSTTSVASFLTGAAALGAKLVTLVEEDEEIRVREDESEFVVRFMGELHRYSAIWDSLEAGFPMQARARGLVEKAILGPRIASAIERAYRRREEMEGDGGWGDWMSSMGFGRIGISFFNHCQARLLLGLFNDGYRVEEGAPNKLVLGWKSRRLVSTSIWSSPPPPSSTTTSGFTS